MALVIQGRGRAVSGVLRLDGASGAPSEALRAGRTVTVRVAGSSGAGRFTVTVGSRTMEAFSELPLAVGSVLAARVEREGSAIVLRLLRSAGDLEQALDASHLPSDLASRSAARALLASGLGVSAERLELLRQASRGPAEGLPRRLRLAAEALKKLPDISAEDAEALVRYVQSGDPAADRDGPESRERRRRDRSARRALSAARVKEALWGGRADGEDAPPALRAVELLRLFNHSRAGDEAWVVLPCRLTDEEGVEVRGTVRVLYDASRSAVRALVVSASGDGGPEWCFRLAPGASGLSCRAYCDDPSAAGRAQADFQALRAQLGNMGVACADTVEDGARFDGFDPSGGAVPRPVDLVG